MYRMIIIGTNAAVNRPMDLMPPMSTAPTSTNMMAPVASTGRPNAVSRFVATALPWVRLPMPNAAIAAKTANR